MRMTQSRKPKISRRGILTATATTVSSIALAGCVGEDDTDDEPDESGEADTDDTGEEEADEPGEILIEYSLSDPKAHDEVPEEVIEHPNPEDFYWVMVEFELVNGSFDAEDIMGLTQIRSGGTEHFTRAVIITSPDDEILTSPDDEYMMPEGTTGEAYYRMQEEPDDPEWVIEQLQNQHGSLEANRH